MKAQNIGNDSTLKASNALNDQSFSQKNLKKGQIKPTKMISNGGTKKFAKAQAMKKDSQAKEKFTLETPIQDKDKGVAIKEQNQGMVKVPKRNFVSVRSSSICKKRVCKDGKTT